MARIIIGISFLVLITFHLVHGWSWQCDSNSGSCSRTLNEIGPICPTLAICHLVCGPRSGQTRLNVWPYPTGRISSSKDTVLIDPRKIQFQIWGDTDAIAFLENVVNYFKEKAIGREKNPCTQPSQHMKIILTPLSNDVTLTLETNESYTIDVYSSGKVSFETLEGIAIVSGLAVNINGETVFGVRHALETLLQVLVPYEENNRACLATYATLKITDMPVYRHRGLLLDSARNFLSIGTIKKNIDGMAASKMNVLHWHITDSQSFPLYLPSLPNMTLYGAYSDRSIYKPHDVKDLVNYAKIRGVRLLIEIDGPSHAGSGWQWGPEAGVGNLAVCINEQPWRNFCIQPPCGQLNPANPNVYNALKLVYRDISAMIPGVDLFHMGGDEVFLPCWNSSQEIIDYLKGKPRTEQTFLDLWGEYHRKALEAYDSAVGHNKTSVIVWTSHLTGADVIEKYLPKTRYIIHTWIPESEEDLIETYLNLGYKVIISTKDKWYLDHGFWGTTLFYNWRKVYENKMYSQPHPNILGGEVCMWGELVDDSNIEPRIWPRAAAAAERLWTNPSTKSNAAESRFMSQRERLVSRGIRAEAEIPKWCVQNEGECSGYL